jgi:hypothetical protein
MHCSSRPWQQRQRFGSGGENLRGGGYRDGGDAALGGGGRDSRGAAAEILGPVVTGKAGTPTAVAAKHADGGGGEARRRRGRRCLDGEWEERASNRLARVYR